MPGKSVHDLALEFRQLSEFLHTGGSPAAARQRLVDLACLFVPGCEWAGITTNPQGVPPRSVASSDDTGRLIDEIQHHCEEGPCVRAARTEEPVLTPDLTTETRWPRFCEVALEQTPVLGVLSFHLTDSPAPTALNLYSSTAGAFDHEAVTTGALFATHASAMMAHADSAHQAATLSAALSTSRQIGAAVGILMAAHKVTETEAFELLRHASNRLNRKLHVIAQDVTDTGELPGRVRR
ncbi:GAF and ANTAR domain-containing protein [Brachybacterium sacelli]|uniref:ANTAR domain-containing protein n=1 Tax=Brachybacterium sacelli TaxID=173364 RepID=A0ABS4WZS0_9MICO|nr:GAF and ANTAR domain-containing protein [Brachybacterium sacelli]MBP2381704.1 hypothetical protein [Brachybacterium sacelli]